MQPWIESVLVEVNYMAEGKAWTVGRGRTAGVRSDPGSFFTECIIPPFFRTIHPDNSNDVKPMHARDPKHSKETAEVTVLFPLVGSARPVKFGALTLLLEGNILTEHLSYALFKLPDAIQIGTIMVTRQEPPTFEV